MKFLHKYFFQTLDKEQKKYIVVESYKSEITLGLVIIIMQLFMIILFLNKEGGVFASWRRTSYFVSYIILFSTTLIFLLSYINLAKNKKYNYCYNMRIVYSIIICMWACFITFLDQWGGNSISVYSYMILSLAAIMIITPIISTLMFCSSFIALNILLSFSPNAVPDFFNNIVNSLFIILLSVFISVRLYFGRINEYANRSVIRKQYQEITNVNERLNYIAITDELTQLKNRRYLNENIAKIFEGLKDKKQYISGLMLDIDFFKQYNDNYGHQQGDVCLRMIGQKILEFTNNENVYAVRYGGEEFFICYFDLTKEQTIEKAEMLRNIIASSGLERDDLPLKCVTVSIGACTGKINEDLTLEYLINRADEALYKAKENGRNCVVFME